MKNKERMYERIRRHSDNLLAIFPEATERDPVNLCRKLRKLEREAAAIGLRLCNGPEHAEGEADTLCAAVLAKVNTLLGNGQGRRHVPIFINQDPRGYALKIDNIWMASKLSRRAYSVAAPITKLFRDWGGYGIIAPDLSIN